ncbi:hypothetical protein AVEN_57324-1 [Araneus ventricosus]|uniref:Uncharacterized protein n=1 Tax=Araneus ventricosus TaxID=182803 RepID=A0A4Y2IPA8_ARAVE|nr:hypothetical protein AVEN_57324-1 [Araneus ventricosus]
MPHFEATRSLSSDGPSSFELRQTEKTTSELAPLLQTSAPHQREDVCPLLMNFQQAQHTTDNQLNRVSNLEPFGHRGRDLTTRPLRLLLGDLKRQK